MHFSNYFINNSKSYLSPRTSQDQPAALQGFLLLCSENEGSPIPLQALELPEAQAMGPQHPWGGGQVTGNLPSRILQVQGSKADPAPWPPDWFGQALSVQKAQVCPTHPGLASAALGALGSQCSQGEETSWTTLKA